MKKRRLRRKTQAMISTMAGMGAGRAAGISRKKMPLPKGRTVRKIPRGGFVGPVAIRTPMNINKVLDGFMTAQILANEVGKAYPRIHKTALDIKKAVEQLKTRGMDFSTYTVPEARPTTPKEYEATAVHTSSVKILSQGEAPGKLRKTKIMLGAPNRTMLRTNAKVNGTYWNNIVDSQQNDWANLPSSNRENLSRAFGFNEKLVTFMNTADLPTVGQVQTDAGWAESAFDWTNSSFGKTTIYGGVMGTRVKHKFANTSTVMNLNIRITLFYSRIPSLTGPDFQSLCFPIDNTRTTQRQVDIPFASWVRNELTADPLQYSGFSYVSPKTSLNESYYWRANAVPVKTVSAKLEPNDIWELNIEEIFPSGVNLEALWNVGILGPVGGAQLSSKAPMGYMLCMECWGDQTEARFNNETLKGTYIGSAAGGFTREFRVDHQYIPPKEVVQSLTNGVTIDFADRKFTFIPFVREILDQKQAIFSIPPSQVGQPASDNLSIPVEKAGGVVFADEQSDP